MVVASEHGDDELDLVIGWLDGRVELRLRSCPRVRSPVAVTTWQELDRQWLSDRGGGALLERWAVQPSRVSIDLVHCYQPEVLVVAGDAIRRAGARRPLIVHRLAALWAPTVNLEWPVCVSWSGGDSPPLVAPLVAVEGGADIHHIGLDVPFELVLMQLLRQARRPRLVVLEVPDGWHEAHQRSPALDPLIGWALASRVSELARHGCPAILATTEVATVYEMLAEDLPLDEVARRLGPACAMLAMIDGAEHAVSMRRALVEGTSFAAQPLEPRLSQPLEPRFSLREVLVRRLRAPRSELESLFADDALRSVRTLREVVTVLEAPAIAIDPQRLTELAGTLARVRDRGRTSLAWALSRPREPTFAIPRGGGLDAMPPRVLAASVHRSNGELVAQGLVVDVEYQLRCSVQFEQPGEAGRIADLLPDLSPLFVDPELELEVVVFALADQFRVDRGPFVLRVPRFGTSEQLGISITPISAYAQPCRLRVGIYHRTRLVQSLAIDVAVRATEAAARQASAPAPALDYVASAELLTVDRGEVPRASLWLNETSDGTHLLGVRVATPGAMPITVHLVDPDLARRLRGYLDDFPRCHDLSSVDERRVVEGGWIALARAGRQAIATLFSSLEGSDALDQLEDQIRGCDGLVEVARCRPGAPGIPWQLMYDPYVSAAADVRVCPVVVETVLARPSAITPTCAADDRCAHRRLVTGRDDPPAQAALDPDRTVCPFGFWGLRHRIAQPIARTRATDLGTNPPARGSGERRVVVPYYEFNNAGQHLKQLGAIARRYGGQLASSSSYDVVVDGLHASAAVLYFYCHGEVTGELKRFVLKIGKTAEDSRMLDVDALFHHVPKPRWTPHRPVVILNGCETLQIVPDREEIHLFLDALRVLGAGAVIGTEVPMLTDVAASVGEQLIEGILRGTELERVVLDMRRSLLAGLNARGLAYNVYGPAGFTYAGQATP